MVATSSKTGTSEQFAARELVRDWAATSGATAAARAIEQGEPNAWRPVFGSLTDLGLFGVAVPEDCGGAGGSIEDLCAMVEETAKVLVPGPVATTALATLVVADPQLRAALTNRVIVEQAKGLLRQLLDVSVEEAFRLLRTYARANGEHLTDVARRLMSDRHSRPLLAPMKV